MTESLAGSAAAAPLSMRAAATLTSAAVRAARQLVADIERGRRIDAAVLRGAMEAAFCAPDTTGVWNWTTAYDVCEAATVLFLRKFGPVIRLEAGSMAAMLPMLARIARCLPTHTRRSEDSQALQQFSTPVPLAFAACTAAGMTLVLNKPVGTRAALLDQLFPDLKVTRFDAAQIDDYLDAGVVSSVVLMNPPFSALANVDRRMSDAALRHTASALARLCEDGRLVAITGASLAPDNPARRDAFARLQPRGREVFSAAIDGALYAIHGTQTDTRLLVIDKQPAADPNVVPASVGIAGDVATLLDWVIQHVPPRLPVVPPDVVDVIRRAEISRSVGASAPHPSSTSSGAAPEGAELTYETVEWSPPEGARITDALYEEYALQAIRIPAAHEHPTKLVQSAAMASVAPPKPSYRPHLLSSLVADGIILDAQLESVIYAGEAHSEFLAGSWTDATFNVVAAARDDAENAVRFRQGWFLGDGAGTGEGRQVASILIDNWLKGRRRALWISKSGKLIEDAQRDWSAPGMERLLVTPLSRFRQGTPTRLSEGVLFTTYATLRTDERGAKLSRVRQIVDWLNSDSDGVIVFDESHAMQNAAGQKGKREGLQLRRVRAMGAYRIELSGFNDTMRDRLRAYGLSGEIISWKLRMFVPKDASGVEILSKVLDASPVERIGERDAA
ncbi:hypothetical protein ACVWWO_003409 [Bradyrhizobium sp. F1.13.1]